MSHAALQNNKRVPNLAVTKNLAARESQLIRLTEQFKKVCVVGLGYVGLPTAFMFSLGGYHVYGTDIRSELVDSLKNGSVGDIYPELVPWWKDIEHTGAFFQADTRPKSADVFLITVPTPIHAQDNTCDLSMVYSAVDSILPLLKPNNLIILESTVPPGTTEDFIKKAIESKTDLIVGETVFLCFSPERVLPGNTTRELLYNDRLLGGVTEACGIVGQTFLQTVLKGDVHQTTAGTAEFCKLAENTYRDVNIALANELSMLAEGYNIDINEARALINLHPRVNLLQPGIGVGGHCIAVDPWFLVEHAPSKTPIIQAARKVNDSMPQHTAEKIMADLHDISSPRICLAGMTYKPNVGDTRESPSIQIYEYLQQKGYDVIPYDPLVPEYRQADLLDSVKHADYLAVLVNHNSIQEVLSQHLAEIKVAMRTPRIRVF